VKPTGTARGRFQGQIDIPLNGQLGSTKPNKLETFKSHKIDAAVKASSMSQPKKLPS
jgi:hypothetical protein